MQVYRIGVHRILDVTVLVAAKVGNQGILALYNKGKDFNNCL